MSRNQKGVAAIEYAILIGTFCTALLTVIPSATNSMAFQFGRFNFALASAGSGGGGSNQVMNLNLSPLGAEDGGAYGGGTDGTVGHCDDSRQVWEPSIFRCVYP